MAVSRGRFVWSIRRCDGMSSGEALHQPTRQPERQMRRFKSTAHAQRFLWVHELVRNLFRVGRHLLRAAHHRLLRTRSVLVWNDVTGTC